MNFKFLAITFTSAAAAIAGCNGTADRPIEDQTPRTTQSVDRTDRPKSNSLLDWSTVDRIDLLTALETETGSPVILRDARDDAYGIWTVSETARFGELALEAGQSLALRAELAGGNAETESLIRVEISGNEQNYRYDILIHLASGRARNRGDTVLALTADSGDQASVVVNAIIPPIEADGLYQVRLFPAATLAYGAGYSQEAMGENEVRRLETAVFTDR